MKNKIISSMLLILCFSELWSVGNLNYFETGAAIYRDLAATTPGHHWHSALFNYFTYKPNEKRGYMVYTEIYAAWLGNYLTTNRNENKPLTVSSFASDLDYLKDEFKDKFREGRDYNGSYSSLQNIITPNTRAGIVATGRDMTSCDLYCWENMIDPENHWQNWPPGWYENWKGTIGDIDEIRCDAIVEFSYEDNDIEVSNYKNIATAGNDYVKRHNSQHFHETGYDWPELCPKIQAGENHGGSGVKSNMSPLVSAPPVVEVYNTTNVNSVFCKLLFPIIASLIPQSCKENSPLLQPNDEVLQNIINPRRLV